MRGKLRLNQNIPKYFGGDVTVTKGELATDTVVIVNDKTTVNGGKFSADTITIGRYKDEANNIAEASGALSVTAGELVAGTINILKTNGNTGVTLRNAAADIGALEVASGAGASFAAASKKVVAIDTVKNAGNLSLVGAEVNTSAVNSGTLTVSGSKFAKLENSKVVEVSGDTTIASLTNDKSGTITFTGDNLTLKVTGASANAGSIGVASLKSGAAVEITGGELVNTGVIAVNTVTVAKGGKLTSSFAFNPENNRAVK